MRCMMPLLIGTVAVMVDAQQRKHPVFTGRCAQYFAHANLFTEVGDAVLINDPIYTLCYQDQAERL